MRVVVSTGKDWAAENEKNLEHLRNIQECLPVAVALLYGLAVGESHRNPDQSNVYYRVAYECEEVAGLPIATTGNPEEVCKANSKLLDQAYLAISQVVNIVHNRCNQTRGRDPEYHVFSMYRSMFERARRGPIKAYHLNLGAHISNRDLQWRTNPPEFMKRD